MTASVVPKNVRCSFSSNKYYKAVASVDKLTAQSNNVRLCHVFPTHDNFADRHLGITEEDAAVMLEEIHVNVSIFCFETIYTALDEI